jgi:probable addiction module antidote protein
LENLSYEEKRMDKFRDYHELLIESLQDPAEAQAYLEVAIEEFILDHDRAAFLQALRAVAEAQGGLLNLSKKSNLNRQNLYKALSPRGNPKLDTVGSIIKGLGFRISIELDNNPNARTNPL